MSRSARTRASTSAPSAIRCTRMGSPTMRPTVIRGLSEL